MPVSDSKVCLATVTTKEFIPGTLVMLHSFLKQNRWFNGDLVIIHDELNVDNRNDLSRSFKQIQFLQVSPQLKRRLEEIIALRPDLDPIQARFYSLEVLRLRGYDRVLFCDSDLLFRKSIEELFSIDQALLCCGEGAYYLGNCRERASYIEVSESASDGKDVLRDTFNSGFLLIGRAFLTEDDYAKILSLVNCQWYNAMKLRMADEPIFNLYFAGQQRLVSGAYNYLLPYAMEIHKREHIGLSEARVLHFLGPTKPWQIQRIVQERQQDPAFIKACEFWYDAFLECLQFLHFKAQFPDMRSLSRQLVGRFA